MFARDTGRQDRHGVYACKLRVWVNAFTPFRFLYCRRLRYLPVRKTPWGFVRQPDRVKRAEGSKPPGIVHGSTTEHVQPFRFLYCRWLRYLPVRKTPPRFCPSSRPSETSGGIETTNRCKNSRRVSVSNHFDSSAPCGRQDRYGVYSCKLRICFHTRHPVYENKPGVGMIVSS